jgi:hypothetical protein
MKGEYYVFCRRCGLKVFNTEAKYQHETGWICKKHGDEIIEHTSTDYRHTETVFKPKIVRKPVIKFIGDDITTWEEIEDNWEDISTNWENT